MLRLNGWMRLSLPKFWKKETKPVKNAYRINFRSLHLDCFRWREKLNYEYTPSRLRAFLMGSTANLYLRFKVESPQVDWNVKFCLVPLTTAFERRNLQMQCPAPVFRSGVATAHGPPLIYTWKIFCSISEEMPTAPWSHGSPQPESATQIYVGQSLPTLHMIYVWLHVTALRFHQMWFFYYTRGTVNVKH